MTRLPRKVLGIGASDAMAKNDYAAAILECRADITQYTIWHKSHTEPFIQSEPERVRAILDVDLKALAELVDILLRCYSRTEAAQEIPQVLERLRSNIQDARWQRKITYFYAVDAYLMRF